METTPGFRNYGLGFRVKGVLCLGLWALGLGFLQLAPYTSNYVPYPLNNNHPPTPYPLIRNMYIYIYAHYVGKAYC